MRHKFRLPEIAHLVEFIASSRRGICKDERSVRASHGEDEGGEA
ncbi:MAG: hypothetical protein WDO13_12290 [Verrucomicrobiota bacterium]